MREIGCCQLGIYLPFARLPWLEDNLNKQTDKFWRYYFLLQMLPSWKNACTCCFRNRINFSVRRLSPLFHLSVCASDSSYWSVTSSPSPGTVQNRRLWRGKRKKEIPRPSRVEGESCPKECHNRDCCKNWALAPDCFMGCPGQAV